MIDLERITAEMKEWKATKCPPETLDDFLLGAGEELGELYRHHIRSKRLKDDVIDIVYALQIQDDIADLIIYLIAYCADRGICMEYAIEKAWNEVKQRDYIKYPGTGRPPKDETPVQQQS